MKRGREKEVVMSKLKNPVISFQHCTFQRRSGGVMWADGSLMVWKPLKGGCSRCVIPPTSAHLNELAPFLCRVLGSGVGSNTTKRCQLQNQLCFLNHRGTTLSRLHHKICFQQRQSRRYVLSQTHPVSERIREEQKVRRVPGHSSASVLSLELHGGHRK